MEEHQQTDESPPAPYADTDREQAHPPAQAPNIEQLTQQLATSHKQMSALHAVSLRVSRSLDLEQVMEQAVGEVTRVLEVEAAAISVIEPQTGDLVIRAQRGLQEFAHTPVRIPTNKGVAWETIKTKQHLVIDSWDNESRLAVPDFRKEHVSTTIMVPMLTGGEPVGVLSAMSRVPRAFTQDEVNLLSGIADHVAIAVKNAHLHEQTRRQSHERAFLFDLAAAIVPLQNIDDIARESLRRTLDFLNWPIGVFLIEETTSSALVPKARIGDDNTLQVLINRTRDTGYQQNILHPVTIHHAETSPHTVIQIPIQARYHTLGWLILGNPDAVDVPAHIQEVLTTESNHLGVAVENVQLYHEMAEREKSSRALYQITRAMTGYNLPEMLRQILEELHNGIPYEASGILLAIPQRIEIMRLRVALTSEKQNDIQAHLHASLNTMDGFSESRTEDTHIIIRGQEDGTLDTDALLSYLEVPIMVVQENESMGVILLARRQPFLARDQRLLFILAYQLSKVLTTIQLFHQAQEQARQLEEINALLRAQEISRAEILNDVAQELRTPITFVQSYVELLHEETLGSLNPAQEEALYVLQEQARLLSRLARDLSMLKAITPQTLRPEHVYIIPLLNQALANVQDTIEEQDKTIKTAFDPDLPLLWIDPDYIGQVLDILLNNAINFTPRESAITLSARHYDDHHIRVAVTAEVTDIAQEELALIFGRLYQSRLGRKYPGIGINLALAQHIITTHNGRLGVEAYEDKGNTFYFLLPK